MSTADEPPDAAEPADGDATLELLALAIERRRAVTATYHGRPRVLSPHALGVKDGRLHCLAYQSAGHSRSGLPCGGDWRCFRLDELEEVALAAVGWASAPNYTPDCPCVGRVLHAVPPGATVRAPAAVA